MNQTEQEIRQLLQESADILKMNNNDSIRASVRKLIETEMTKAMNFDVANALETSTMDDEEWFGVMDRMTVYISRPFETVNAYDAAFFDIAKEIMGYSLDNIVEMLKKAFFGLKVGDQKRVEEYFDSYSFWGSLNPEENNWTSFENRAKTLKHHIIDFMWLYERFEDYDSKYTLIALIKNWLKLDTNFVSLVKSPYKDYFEPDIFRSNRDDVFVDVGAYVGDSIVDYASIYGAGYKKIYAYEISKESYNALIELSKTGHDIYPINKGVGDHADWLVLEENDSSDSANKLKNEGEGTKVELVTLDDDIKEPVTFIKMDVEGAEYGVLCGARQHIINEKPKLAVCVYHGYDDLWRLPVLIESIRNDYKFYFRHYGGNLIPTEFVLICK
ncbi:MAG: FkbM family methyltransferase [Lachnospiraceae bacterium]|nr:FkbM family methyltransferase [Lachnospiraceae bacterium]